MLSLRVDVYLHSVPDTTVASKLDAILAQLTLTRQEVAAMAVDFTAIEAEVARNTSVDESANILLVDLTRKIEELKQGSDPATQQKIDELVASLRGSTDKLASAVVANTPQAG